MLAIFETHPVQYHAPVYQALAKQDIEFEVVYSSDFSVRGYHDREFQANFAWDTDLLGGYRSRFLRDVAHGGATCYELVRAEGISSALASLQPSAVLCLGYRVPFDAGVIRSTNRLRLPLMMRSEASDSALNRNRLKAWLRDWILQRLYKRCKRLLYVGVNNRHHYRRLGVPDCKLTFSPYCVSTSAFQYDLSCRGPSRRAMRRRLNIDDDAICIMFCGKLSKRKGVDLLLQAVKRLPLPTRSKVTLLMVGEGVLRAELTALASSPPAVSMQITGFKNQHELSPYYHASDLAVLPSIQSETWGLVVNEALLHGVPCVVSDRVGCAPDLIEPDVTGQVFRAGDVDNFCEALVKSLLLLDTKKVADACQARVAGYSVELAARGIREAFLGLAEC